MNISDPNNFFGENQNNRLTYLPNFSHAFHNLIIPFNNSFVEVPDAKAEDLTPRGNWIAKTNDIERKLLDERNKTRVLQDRIKELEFNITNLDKASNLNVEQLSAHIFSLNRELDIYKAYQLYFHNLKRKEETFKDQLRQEQEYTKSIQAIAKENEEKYLTHLNKVKLEYESLQNQMTQLTQSYNNLNKEHATLQGTNIELRSELSKLQGIYSAEKTVLQAQANESKAESLKLSERYIELTRQAERHNVEASNAGERISQLQKENREKDHEIKRITDLLTMAESRAQALSSESQDKIFSRAEAMSTKFREEKLDLEMRIKLEQNKSDELQSKVQNLSESNAKYRLEAENLKVKLLETEAELNRIRISERDLISKFDQVKKKYDEHFEKVETSAFSKELRNAKLVQQVETLTVEKDFQEKLIFQYQQFLRSHKLEHEFNSIMRVDKNAFSNVTADTRHEAKERAAREFAAEKHKKTMSAKVKEVENTSQKHAQEKITSFRKGLENMEDDLDQEWKKLFSEISTFEQKLNVK